MKTLLTNNWLRRGVRILLALTLTFLLYWFYFQTDLGWMMFSIFFVMLTPFGSSLSQGMLRFVLLTLMLFAMNHLSLGIATAGILGILVNTFCFKDRIELEFAKAVTPYLKLSAQYFAAIVERILVADDLALEKAKNHFENAYLKIPTWVFDTTLALPLQKGYRFYVLKLYQLADILFAMSYLARYSYDNEWKAISTDFLLCCVTRVEGFVLGVSVLLHMEKLKEGVIDFEDEIIALENQIKKLTPDMHFMELLTLIKELRGVLIQLAQACRP